MTWPFVHTLIHHEVVSSTNDLAKQLALHKGIGLPLAVWADRQTQGRGRGSHTWWSDAGSLTFSLLLDPRAHGLRIEHEPRLALAAAVAVVDAVEASCGVSSLGIRWPNDLEAFGRKLGGILPERIETARGPLVVVGIGLNVSCQLADSPHEVRRLAIALPELASPGMQVPDRAVLLGLVLEHCAKVLSLLARDDPALARRWQSLDTLVGQPIRVDLGPQILAGIGRGIDAEGALLVASERETVRLFGGQVLREDGG